MVRVTEAAAIESARFMGRGAKDEADAAATQAMRARVLRRRVADLVTAAAKHCELIPVSGKASRPMPGP